MPNVPKFRSTITYDEISGFRITIPAKTHWVWGAVGPVWLCFWAFGEVAAGRVLVTGITRGEWGGCLFLLLWLTFWTAGGILALLGVLWNIGGREIILINNQDFVVRRELGGFRRERSFALASVRNLRYSPLVYDPFSFSQSWKYNLQVLGIGGGSVAFDNGDKTYRFGNGLSEVESRRLIKTVRDYFKIEGDQDEGLPVLT